MTTPEYLVQPPTNFVISITPGGDCQFTLNRIDADEDNVDWNAAVTMNIEICHSFTQTFTAVVNSSQALFTLPAATVNECHSGTTWQIFMTTTNPTLITPVAVGTFERITGAALA